MIMTGCSGLRQFIASHGCTACSSSPLSGFIWVLLFGSEAYVRCYRWAVSFLSLLRYCPFLCAVPACFKLLKHASPSTCPSQGLSSAIAGQLLSERLSQPACIGAGQSPRFICVGITLAHLELEPSVRPFSSTHRLSASTWQETPSVAKPPRSLHGW
jgi:hypothetical protein